ncbi:hypothetical protein B0H11DRAFT_1923957 [Mycena galericulata]|nr:hypothetical protein B0H11DRAFT_1923942 [Mycena galericulata]KAJ7460358.1 hypothetical protein B0H11DRAFT_1923957 [Mycena galericulata]
MPVIDNMEEYLHIVQDIRRRGPAVRFSIEVFECFEATFRLCSVLSNRQAPSRDIAAKFADLVWGGAEVVEDIHGVLCQDSEEAVKGTGGWLVIIGPGFINKFYVAVHLNFRLLFDTASKDPTAKQDHTRPPGASGLQPLVHLESLKP